MSTDGILPFEVFPFIVGCPRSGTTLLRAMLDSHDDLAVPPESYFVAAFARRRPKFDLASGFAVEAFLDALCSHRWFVRWGLDEREVKTRILEGAPANTAEAIRAVYRLYTSHRSKRRYGDKTPEYVCSMRTISGLLPEARFVHLIRDGRDVARSLCAAAGFGLPDLASALLFWERRVITGRKQGERLGSSRYREVRYEDLTSDPEGVLRDVCAFVELDYQPEMLGYYNRVDEILVGVPGHQHHRRLRQAPVTGLRDWRRDLSASDIGFADALVGPVLGSLGYERSTIPATIRSKTWARRVRIDADVRHVAGALKSRVRGPRFRDAASVPDGNSGRSAFPRG
jgi:hypothetical protein